MLAPLEASAVVLMALVEAEPDPTPESIAEFVRGPIARALLARTGRSADGNMIERLAKAGQSGAPAELGHSRPTARIDAQTVDVRTAGKVITVTVVAKSQATVRALQLSLGYDRAMVGHARSADQLELMMGMIRPRVVLFDMTDFPSDTPPEDLVRALGTPTEKLACVVWSDDAKSRAQLMRALDGAGFRNLGVDRAVGSEAVIDVLKAWGS